MRNNLSSISALIIIALAIMLLIAGLHLALQNPSMPRVEGIDYRFFFEPALHTPSPYDVRGFFNPFWTLLPVWIMGIFGGYQVAAWITLNISLILFVCVKMKMPGWIILPFFVFSGALMGAFVGNIEGLVALGLVLPTPVGLIFLMIKPQVGTAIALYYALDSVLHDGWRRTIVIFAPLVGLLVASVVLYGTWFLNSSLVVGMEHNTIHFFPYGVPVGLTLIFAGALRRNIGYALMAIPMTTPYMIFHTWMFPIMGAILVICREWDTRIIPIGVCSKRVNYERN